MSTPTILVKPEVAYLADVVDEALEGRLRIPRFQRAYVWNRGQMRDLLDSVFNQYPIGSLLIWEAGETYQSFDRLGVFDLTRVKAEFKPGLGAVGYVLDGHQRLSTLAGALATRRGRELVVDGDDPGRWEVVFNLQELRFEHVAHGEIEGAQFPLTALFETVDFIRESVAMQNRLQDDTDSRVSADQRINEAEELASAFRNYRLPVVRVRVDEPESAVKIFERMNSRGQSMSADQMVSALTYEEDSFDLAAGIDELQSLLSSLGFGDVDRSTMLRCVLANAGQDIYRMESWLGRQVKQQTDVIPAIRAAVPRTADSLEGAVNFLRDLGVGASRLLPYSAQLIILSAFFGKQQSATEDQLLLLRRWYWVSSFSGWFGGANPSRVSALLRELSGPVASNSHPAMRLAEFDLETPAQPYPTNFDLRSARTRVQLAVQASMNPEGASGPFSPTEAMIRQGADAIGSIFAQVPAEWLGDPANRLYRAPDWQHRVCRRHLLALASEGNRGALAGYGVGDVAVQSLEENDVGCFLDERRRALIQAEGAVMNREGVQPYEVGDIGPAAVDG